MARRISLRITPPTSGSTTSYPTLPLLFISGIYVALCVWMHAGRAWQGDEWGTYLAFRDPYHHLLTHFGGWQTMNFYLAGLKAIHDVRGGANWLLVLPGIAAGVWLLWLMAALALALGSGRSGAAIAALLTAVNPFLVKYGVTIRSYIFLAALSAAMLLAFLSWRRTGRWRDGVQCGVWGALALLAHLNALYTYIAIAVLAACWTVLRIRLGDADSFHRLWRLVIPVAVLGALSAAAYIPQLEDIRAFRRTWSDAPPIALTFVPSLFSRFFGDGYLVLPPLLMLIYGSWRACRERRQSQWIILAVLVGFGSISLAGVSHFPWAYSRFLIAFLPWFILLIADACTLLSCQSRIAAYAVVLLIAGCSMFSLSTNRQALHAMPWHRVAQYLRVDKVPGDRCVLLGRPVLMAALDVYGVPCHYNLSATLRALPPDQPLRLKIIVVPRQLVTSLPTQILGEARIVTVSGLPASIAATVTQALVAGTQERISGELSDTYANIAGLMRWLGPTTDAPKYDMLQIQSRARTARVRNQPPQFWNDVPLRQGTGRAEGRGSDGLP